MAHDRRLCDGELVDFSLFACFGILIFTRESPTDLSSRKKEQVLVFFSFLSHGEKRTARFQLCDFGCGIRRSGSRLNQTEN